MIEFHATRLAPSPTGALHLGHARTFLITWWMARQCGANIYMRMEDLDAGRARPEAVRQAYDDLRWLGMDWDAYGESENSKHKTQNSKLETQNEVVQSERLALYEAALEALWSKGAAYPCVCTRADIAANVAASASAPHEGEAQPRYPGTCRRRFAPQATLADTLAAVRAATGKPACFRFLVPPGNVDFEDVLAGPQSFDVSCESGDFPITRFSEEPPSPPDRVCPLFPPAYQLACVVDDHAMGIDLVIRGDDLLPSTPRQILLYQALGYPPPRFAHLSLVVGPDGRRLAKRHGESRIAQFRAAGIAPERIVGWVAWRSGQLERPQEISARDLLPKFDLTRLPHERVILGPEDLAFLRP
jgi:glutamyl-tRNA synthetase